MEGESGGKRPLSRCERVRLMSKPHPPKLQLSGGRGFGGGAEKEEMRGASM